MATAGSIVIDLLAKTGSFETDMNRARRKVNEFDNDLKGMIARLDRASVALAGVAAAAAGWVALTMQTVKTMDATSKMADQIGVTTEALTGLRFAAQQFANVSDQTFDMALRRMTRRIEEAAQGSGGAKAAFEAMGLSAKELARLSPDQQFMRIADAMQKTDTQAQRLKNTMAIFDTEGMPLVNALSQGSKELERNIELATRYGVVLSTEAARSAEQFTNNLSRLSSIQDGMRQQLTTAMLPALERLSGYMLGVAESALEVGNSRHRLEEFSRVAVEFVDDLARSYAGLTVIGRGVLDMLAELDEAALGWLKPFKTETVAATTILTQSFSESVLNTAREIDKLVGLAGGVMAVWKTVGDNIPLYFRVAWNKVLEGAAAFVNSLSDLVNPMLETMGMDGFGKVAWGENVVVGLRSISESFREGYESAKAASGMAERVQAAYDGVAISTAKAAKTVNESTGGLAGNGKASEAARKAAEAFRKEQERALVAHYQSISAIHAQAQGIEDQVALFGQSKSALEDLTIARLEEEAVVLRMYGDRSKAAVEAIEAEIEARKRLRTAIGSLEQKEAEKAAWESWAQDVKTVFDQVGQSLTDAIFDGGKSGLDLLKDWAKTLTLRVFVQPIMGAMQGMVTNQLGGLFGMRNPQGGMMQHASSLNSIFGAGYQALTGATPGASAASLGYANTVGMFGGDSIGALIQANGGWQGALSGLSSATSAAVTAGALSAAPTVAASLSTSFGTAATTMASTSFTASLGGGAAAAGAGGAGGLMAGLSAAAPWIGGALAIGSLLGGGLFDREPTTRREQRTQVEYAGGLLDITKRDDRVQAGADAAVAQMTAAAIQSANNLFQNIGIDATIESFRSIMASSYKRDRDGVASGGTLRVGDQLIDFGITDDTNPTLGGFGGWSSVDPMQRIGTEIQLSMLEALKAVSDELPSVLSSMLAVDIRSLDEAGAADLVARFTALTEGASAFLAAIERMPFDYLRDVTFDAAANMVQFADGIDNLLAAQQAYYERFYSDAERHGHAVDQLTQALAGVGVEMPALVGSTDDMLASYRALVESLDLNTEAGQRAYVTLMQTAGAFADVAQFAGRAAVDLERAAEGQRRAAEQALQQALSGLSTAYNAVVQAGQREIARLQESFSATDSAMSSYRSAVQRLESEFNSLFSAIDRGIQALRGTGAAFDAQYHQARAVISTTLLTGQLPQTADLSEAIRVAQQGVMGQRFASREDQQRAYLTLANELEGIKGIAEPELDTAKATLSQLETQYRLLRGMSLVGEDSLSALESQLRTAISAEEAARRQISLIERQIEEARRQYDALIDLDTSIKDLATAMREFAAAVEEAAAAQTAVGGGGGNSTAPGSSYSQAAAYYAANPDVASAFNRGDGGSMSFDEFARHHYETYGRYEGRSYDVGTSYVPYDMMANVHRGETIIDPRSSDILRRYGIEVRGGTSRETEQLLREQLSEVRQQNRYLYEIVKSGKRTANHTETMERSAMETEGLAVVAYG